MSFSSSTVSIGDSTKQADYARLMANTVYNKAQTISEISRLQSGTVSFEGAKTFQSSVIMNGGFVYAGISVSIATIVGSIGESLSITGIGAPALAALDSTHVVFIDSALEELRTYVWSGSAWSLEGSALSISGIGLPALAALDSTHVVFIDNTLAELRTYVWSGSAWSLEGSALSIIGIGAPALAALDSTHVVFIDNTLEKLRTYVWNKLLSINT